MKSILGNVKTGQDFEACFFGRGVYAGHKKPDSQAPLMREQQFLDAIKHVKTLQKSRFDWNPFEPKTGAGNLLYLGVVEHLPAALGHDLGIYAAVGTVLDHYGMDGFMMTKNVIVGIDFTINEDEADLKKKQTWAAHAFKIGRPIVIIEKRHLEREDGLGQDAKTIAKHLESLFQIQQGEKIFRRFRRLNPNNFEDYKRYRSGELVFE